MRSIACASLATLLLFSAQAHAEPPDAKAALTALAQQAEAKWARRPLVSGKSAEAEIAASVGCARPTKKEQRALHAAVTKGIAADDLVMVRYGCKEPSGIIVDVSFDVVKEERRTGVWRVVHVSTAAAKVEVVAEHRGTSKDDFMEWASEITLETSALFDLDGDGERDAMIVQTSNEGGAPPHVASQEVSLWRSRDRLRVPVATFDSASAVTLVRGTKEAPFVLEAEGRDEQGEAAYRYRCLDSNGAASICPAAATARRARRAQDVAAWFRAGSVPGFAGVPDRELVEGLLREIGISAQSAEAFLRALPVTSPGVRVGRWIAAALAPPAPTKHGELQPIAVVPEVDRAVDPRVAKLMKALGDAPCDAPSAAAKARALAEVDAWRRGAEERAALRANKCPKCTWSAPSAGELVSVCASEATGTTGYVWARWGYAAGDFSLQREVVLLLGAHPRALAAATRLIKTCSACGEEETESLSVELRQRGAAKIATVFFRAPAAQSTRVYVDGALAAPPPAGAAEITLLEPQVSTSVVLATRDGAKSAWWHFDGRAWQRLGEDPTDVAGATPPALQLLFDDEARTSARRRLRSFGAKAWEASPQARLKTRQALVLGGLPKSLIARIDAEAAKLPQGSK